MKSATATTLRANLNQYLNQSEPVVVTQKGRPRAVLMPVANEDDVERLLMANSAELMQLLDEADQRISASGGIPHDAFWSRIREQNKMRKPAAKRTKIRKARFE